MGSFILFSVFSIYFHLLQIQAATFPLYAFAHLHQLKGLDPSVMTPIVQRSRWMGLLDVFPAWTLDG